MLLMIVMVKVHVDPDGARWRWRWVSDVDVVEKMVVEVVKVSVVGLVLYY